MIERDPIGRAALGMLELIKELEQDPKLFKAFEAEVRAKLPSSYADQLDAAARDADHLTRIAGALWGEGTEQATMAQAPEWLTLQVAETALRYATGTGRTCMHNPDPNKPQPLFAALWRPLLVVCERCTHLLSLRPGSEADRTCDGCGRVFDGIYPGMGSYGPLSFQYGVCAGCRWEPEGPTT